MSEIDLILKKAMKKKKAGEKSDQATTPKPVQQETRAETTAPETRVTPTRQSTTPPETVSEKVKAIDIAEEYEKMVEKIEGERLPFEEEEAPPKLVITIYGEKGSGKTTTALGFRERVLALSFDGKTSPVKFNMYRNEPRIRVLNPIRYWDKSDREKITESAKEVWSKIMQTLDYVEERWRPDWIVVDAVEEFEKLLEQVMRYDYHLGPYDGIANRNIWKYRKDLFSGFLAKALRVARYGVIFTTYPDYSEIIVNGEVVNRKRVPKWADYLQMVTDVVIYTDVDDNTGEYRCKIITSKFDDLFPSGRTFNVTGKNLWDVLNLSKKIKDFLNRKTLGR